jgi:predicted DsbA family dithiol-disulfide isomerase
LPFDLHPEYPPTGKPREAWYDRIRPRFEEEGLVYNPNPDVIPRTLDALRLAELARDLGRHQQIHDRFMDAYWEGSIDLTSHHELRQLVRDLPGGDVERVLASDEYRARVDASTAQAQSIGINGIPAWLIDGKLLVPGAQPRDVFRRAFEQLAA